MKIITTALLSTLLLSNVCQAEWFFRGTANNWQALALEQTATNKFETCQAFTDANGRFKIDRTGDWAESYPSADFTVTTNQTYKITFISDTKAISTQAVTDCNTFSQNFTRLNFRGTPNSWNNQAMTLVSNNTWQTTVVFDGQANQRFKLDVLGDWSQNYGGSNGAITLNGGDITTAVNGEYIVSVDDAALTYSLTATNVPVNAKPIAVISPSANQTVVLGSSLTLSAANSSDSDGTVNVYSWSTAESTQSISVSYNTIGTHTVSLTVSDNDGAVSNIVSVTINVINDTNPNDSWFFRGTSNNWATTAMDSTDNINFCTEQNFGSSSSESNPRFKVDHFADWTESYPTADITVANDTSFNICFNASTKAFSVTELQGIDNKAPTVTALPSAGFYSSSQSISFSVIDNQDLSPKIYCTTDSSTPTASLPLCNNSTFTANDINSSGVDLSIQVLAVDATGNSKVDTFNYTIGAVTGGSGDFREENVYFIMTDRFADGDTSNNNIWGDEYLPNGAADKYNTNTSKTGPLSYYHGGDFQGIINNLDYIQGMGFTAIWITPVVKQPEGRHIYDPNDPITGGGGDAYAASAFHGYWGYDFDQIDPHLHSLGKNNDGWSGFDALVDALHARGMKMMLDIVVNHGHPTAVSQSSKNFAKRQTIIMDGREWVWETNDPYYDATQTPPTDGFFSYANGTWLIDLIDFNEHGSVGKNATEHLKNVYKRFIDHGVDAFRIDTVSYMSAGFWEEFTLAMDAHAKTLGNDNFYMAGEAWTGDRTAAVNLIYNGAAKKFNMLDLHGSSMDFPGWMSRAFKNEAGFDDPNGWARIAGTGGDASGIYDPTFLSTFVDNHDVTRANGILNQTQYMNNLNFIYLFRGLPIVFYGTEVLYSSWPNYITTTEKEDVVARWMLGSDGINYAKSNQPTLYKHLKMLNSLRSSSVALQKGQQVDLLMSGDKAVFKRDLGGPIAYVAMSKGAGFSYTFTGLTNGSYRLLTPNTNNGSYNAQTVNVTNGSYTVSVNGNEFVILDKI
jgi:glycosidase